MLKSLWVNDLTVFSDWFLAVLKFSSHVLMGIEIHNSDQVNALENIHNMDYTHRWRWGLKNHAQ